MTQTLIPTEQDEPDWEPGPMMKLDAMVEDRKRELAQTAPVPKVLSADPMENLRQQVRNQKTTNEYEINARWHLPPKRKMQLLVRALRNEPIPRDKLDYRTHNMLTVKPPWSLRRQQKEYEASKSNAERLKKERDAVYAETRVDPADSRRENLRKLKRHSKAQEKYADAKWKHRKLAGEFEPRMLAWNISKQARAGEVGRSLAEEKTELPGFTGVPRHLAGMYGAGERVGTGAAKQMLRISNLAAHIAYTLNPPTNQREREINAASHRQLEASIAAIVEYEQTQPHMNIKPLDWFEQFTGMFASTMTYMAAHIATFGVSTLLAGGDEAYTMAVNAGMSHEHALALSIPVGILYAAIERSQASRLLKGVSVAQAKKGVLEAAKRIGKELALIAVQEGGEEALQRLVVEAGPMIMGETNWEALIQEMGMEAAAGALMGLMFGGVGIALKGKGSYADANPKAEMWPGQHEHAEEFFRAKAEAEAKAAAEVAPEIEPEVPAEVAPAVEEAPPQKPTEAARIAQEAITEEKAVPAPEKAVEVVPEAVTPTEREAKPAKKPAPAKQPEKEPWEISQKEYVGELPRGLLVDPHATARKQDMKLLEQKKYIARREKFHGLAIRVALRAGKPVPRAVLEEYAGEKWADDALAKMEARPAKEPWEYDWQGLDEFAGKEPWQVKSADFKKGFTPGEGQPVGEAIAASDHEAIVRHAVEQGKPVPAEVLAEYPDLAAAPAAPAKRVISEDAYKKSLEHFRDKGKDITLRMGVPVPSGEDIKQASIFVMYHVENGVRKLADVIKAGAGIIDEQVIRKAWVATKDQREKVAAAEKEVPPDAISIKNAAIDAERESMGLEPATHGETIQYQNEATKAARRAKADPHAAGRLIDELYKTPRPLTLEDTFSLLHEKTRLANERLDAQQEYFDAVESGDKLAIGIAQARVDKAIADVFILGEVVTRCGTPHAQAFAARQVLMKLDYSLAAMERERRVAKGGEKLTRQEMAKVKELHDRIAALEKEQAEYIARNTQLQSNLALAREHKRMARAQRRAKTTDPSSPNFGNRNVIFTKAKADAAGRRLADMSKARAGLDPEYLADAISVGGYYVEGGLRAFAAWSQKMLQRFGSAIRPYLDEAWVGVHAELRQKTLDSIAGKIGESSAVLHKDVQSLAESFVAEGVANRDELVGKVHDALRKFDPSITRRATIDAMLGEYRRRDSLGSIKAEWREYKAQLRQVAKLEDVIAGKKPRRRPSRKPQSEEVKKLTKQVREELAKDDKAAAEKILKAFKTRTANRIAELQDRIKRKDFTKKERRHVVMDDDAIAIRYELDKAYRKWHELMIADKLARRTKMQKSLAMTGEGMQASRSIITSFDLSGLSRQGGFTMMSRPILAARAAKKMFGAVGSKKSQFATDDAIRRSKWFPLSQQVSLFISEHGHSLSQMEEVYASRWVEHIPGVAASERAYTTVLNVMRMRLFATLCEKLSLNGEVSLKEAKQIAMFVNHSTGRGGPTSSFKNAFVGMNYVFFAPRWVSSRFQLLIGQSMWGGTWRTRKLIATEYARFLTGLGVMYGAVAMALSLWGDDDDKIETDPRSADFGKIKIGDTRIDPLAGLSQVAVFGTRVATGQTKTGRGKIVPIRGEDVPYGRSDAADVIFRFTRSKLNPVWGAGVNIAAGENVVGEKVTPGTVAGDLLVPMAFRDAYEAMLAQGIEKGTALGLLAIFGVSMQTYEVKGGKTSRQRPRRETRTRRTRATR